MRYFYINPAEDRVVVTSKQPIADLAGDVNLTCYVTHDEFDTTKEVEPGVFIDGFLTATEFLERLNADYVALRTGEYPPIEEYVDGVVKGDQAQIDAYIAACQAVKAKYPKSE